MVLRHHAAALGRSPERDTGGVDKAAHLLAGPRPQNAAAGDHDWTLRLLQDFDRALDQGRVSSGTCVNPIIGRVVKLFGLDRRGQDVAGQVQVDWSLLAVHRLAKGQADVSRNSRGDIDSIGGLDHRPHHRNLVHLLERFHRRPAHRRRAADGDYRSGVAPGVGQTGHSVGGARARRGDTDAGLAGDA